MGVVSIDSEGVRKNEKKRLLPLVAQRESNSLLVEFLGNNTRRKRRGILCFSGVKNLLSNFIFLVDNSPSIIGVLCG